MVLENGRSRLRPPESPVPALCGVSTEVGDFRLELSIGRAPITSAYFIGLVQAGGLDGSSVYRIATRKNQAGQAACPIEIIQAGLAAEDVPVRPVIGHEPTVATGLRHERWSVSMSRFKAGEPYGSFFVCMRDEPELDYGGRRQPDGQGFAAFGRVIAGFSVLQAIYARAEESEFLSRRVRIIRARMLSDAE